MAGLRRHGLTELVPGFESEPVACTCKGQKISVLGGFDGYFRPHIDHFPAGISEDDTGNPVFIPECRGPITVFNHLNRIIAFNDGDTGFRLHHPVQYLIADVGLEQGVAYPSGFDGFRAAVVVVQMRPEFAPEAGGQSVVAIDRADTRGCKHAAKPVGLLNDDHIGTHAGSLDGGHNTAGAAAGYKYIGIVAYGFGYRFAGYGDQHDRCEHINKSHGKCKLSVYSTDAQLFRSRQKMFNA